MRYFGFIIDFFKKIFPIFSVILIIGIFHFTNFTALKFYPATINFLIFLAFFSSLFTTETIIQKIARKMDGELDLAILGYTKNLTYIWCIFLFFNFLISTASIFASAKFWALYNGCVSYVLVGLMFAVEYPIRLAFKRRHSKLKNEVGNV